jgi:signal transduction histidine kinase
MRAGQSATRTAPTLSALWRGLLAAVALIAAVTGIVALLEPHVPVLSLLVLYLLAVLPIAVLWGAGLAAVTAVLSVATFAFLLPPVGSPRIADSQNVVALGVFLVTAVVVAQLAARLRRAVVESARLGDEQAALRRVATLVAQSVPPAAVFEAVTREIGLLCGADLARMERYEADGTVTGVAAWSRVPPRSGELGIRASIGCPILVAGHVWGVIAASTRSAVRFPANTEAQIASFTELVASAVENAEAHAALSASHARIIAAADDTRRRIERDLHDGAQQRLVSLALELRLAQDIVPAELPALRAVIGQAAEDCTDVVAELREMSRGIHPAILTEGGLGPALRMIVRRSTIDVELRVDTASRYPPPLEVAVYYVVSEAITNTTKHAGDSSAAVIVEEQDSTLRLRISDDGVGGAEPQRGSGLIGLRNRVEALGGSMDLASPVGQGTQIHVALPLEQTADK